VTQLPLQVPDLVDSNPLAVRLYQKDVGMMKVIYLQTGSAFITGFFFTMKAIEDLC
jgi:hypothetical protein